MRTPRFFRYLLLFMAMLAVPAASFAGVFVAVNIAPPELPVYEQPLCPGDGYIWTPGYWAWDPDGGYYWVPGAWVFAPYTGALWTPGYWGWGDGGYLFHAGYWGLHIGFYGGVDYGYGYFGHGYEGGYWNHDRFTYNRTINHLDVNRVHNVYERNVEHGPENRVSFNGGNGGVRAEASANERIAEHERHIGAVPLQQQHEHAAAGNRAQFANVNHGQPAVAATQRAGGQAFHQAMAHPNNPQAVQAARSAPNVHNNAQNNARPAVENHAAPANQPQNHPMQGRPQMDRSQSQARPAPQQQAVHPAQQARPVQQARPQQEARPVQQARPEPQARPAAPAQQARPQGGGGGAPHAGGGEPHGGGGEDHGHH